jgi:UDP-N-acetylmuramoyl-L-alanyl-D-glutamate--2,6-diaminopimelate ligase
VKRSLDSDAANDVRPAGNGLIASPVMELAALVAGSHPLQIVGDPAVSVAGLSCHSGSVEPGTLFFCIPGTLTDGHDFAAQAVASGAVALVVERPLDAPVPQIVVASARRAMALAAARFFGDPTRDLQVTAITGTNGKTTTAHLVAAINDAAGLPSALLGTVANRIGGVEHGVTLTTADSIDLQRMFREMVDAGDRACAMEASSHALFMDRTVGIDFDAVVFTNLTRDHLDFHAGLDDYYLAKRRLFLPDEQRQPHAVAVVNVGDEWGRRLAGECAPAYGDDLYTYTLRDGEAAETAAPQATVVAADLDLRADGSSFTLRSERLAVDHRLTIALGGHFNVANAAAAATAALAAGLPAEAAVAGLAGTPGVPGRFESVRAGQPYTVLVDYAHTPDSLENALLAARGICARKLSVVFGCGGDRDRGKRPQMGAIGARLADRAIVTSDNPRSEDPLAIIDQILAGVPRELRDRVAVEPDRWRAIGLAFEDAGAGDVVLIAGKGHESGQVIGSRKVPFDDRAVARELLLEKRFGE